MARLTESGKIEEVVFARFEPDEDILRALYDVYRGKDIRTSIILDDNGGVVDSTYQHSPVNPKPCPANVFIGTMHGECEVSLQGTIDTTVCNLTEGDTPDTMAERVFPTTSGLREGPVDKWPVVDYEYGSGAPYTRAYYVASNTDYTVCGHLMPGTKIASGDPSKPSHSTVIIAKTSGVELQATIDHKIGFYQNLARIDE